MLALSEWLLRIPCLANTLLRRLTRVLTHACRPHTAGLPPSSGAMPAGPSTGSAPCGCSPAAGRAAAVHPSAAAEGVQGAVELQHAEAEVAGHVFGTRSGALGGCRACTVL